MSLLQRDQLPYPTYDLMLEHILEEIQDRLQTPLDEIVQNGITPNLLNRIQRIARNAYKDLKITYFTYEEMVSILGTDETIKNYKDTSILFTFLKPIVETIETDEGQKLSIEIPLDYQHMN